MNVKRGFLPKGKGGGHVRACGIAHYRSAV